uniref:Large ribosomal subunit protein eL18 n=1 Tax=Ditylenchus dipsaci TaxID=166011 RepID=A0A915EI33_9BILA
MFLEAVFDAKHDNGICDILALSDTFNIKKPGNEKKIAVCVGPSLTTIESIKFLPLRWLLCVLRPLLVLGLSMLVARQFPSTNWPFVRPRRKHLLLQGCRKNREAEKHFGHAPGVPGSHTKPSVRSKGRKFERARGRRKSPISEEELSNAFQPPEVKRDIAEPEVQGDVTKNQRFRRRIVKCFPATRSQRDIAEPEVQVTLLYKSSDLRADWWWDQMSWFRGR